MSVTTFHKLESEDGGYLHLAIIEPVEMEPRAVVLFVAGFESPGFESRRIFLEQARQLANAGVAACLFDYRGYGYSSGEFREVTFQAQCQDMTSVWHSLRRTYPENPVLVWSASFGCAVTARCLVQEVSAAGAVFWGLSADIYARYSERYGASMGARDFGFTDKGSQISKRFIESLRGIDTVGDISSGEYPLLLVHGDADTVAPISLSRRAACTRSGITLVEVSGGNHGFKAQPFQYEAASQASVGWLMEEIGRVERGE